MPLRQPKTLRHAYDQVRDIDDQQIQPNLVLSHPYFSIIKDGYIE